MNRITDILAGLRSLLSSLVVIAVSIALIAILVRQLSSSAIIVEPIQVPAELAAQGYTAEVAAQRVMDGIFDIQRQAITKKARNLIAPEWQRLDMEVPGSGISIGTLGRVVRESMGIVEQKISGEILSSGTCLHLRLRFSGTRQFRESVCQDARNTEALLDSSAALAVQLMEPFMYASYLYANHQKHELEKALDYCLKHCTVEDQKWGHNLRGVMAYDNTDWAGAIEAYEKALVVDQGFAIAYHNLANALQKQGKHQLALDNLLQAIRLDSNLHNAKKEASFMVAAGREMHSEAQPTEAEIELYRRALILNPNEIQAHLSWGNALQAGTNPDYTAAAEQFARGLEKAELQNTLDSDALVAQINVLWGRALAKQGDYASAIKKLQSAIEADPEGYEFLSEEIVQLRRQSH